MWNPFGSRKEERTFWVTLCVDLAEPLQFIGGSDDGAAEAAVGYYQNFGVTAATAKLAMEAASNSALQGPTTGIVRPGTTTVREIDARRMDEEIRRRVGSAWKKPGIWYRSGRIFFPHPQPADGAAPAS